MLADERTTATTPATYISSTGGHLLSALACRTMASRNYVGSLAGDIEQVDWLASFAPKPLLIGAVGYGLLPRRSDRGARLSSAREV